jgi:hypothetical protein
LNPDDLVIRRKDVGPPKPGVLVRRVVMNLRGRRGFNGGLHAAAV